MRDCPYPVTAVHGPTPGHSGHRASDIGEDARRTQGKHPPFLPPHAREVIQEIECQKVVHPERTESKLWEMRAVKKLRREHPYSKSLYSAGDIALLLLPHMVGSRLGECNSAVRWRAIRSELAAPVRQRPTYVPRLRWSSSSVLCQCYTSLDRLLLKSDTT